MRRPGPLGDFYRSGGNSLVVDNLPLNADDIVVDGGGYYGAWTSDILVQYGSRLVVFEPMPEYARRLRLRFGRNSRVEVIEAALSNRRGQDVLSVKADGSTRFPSSPTVATTPIELIDIGDFLLSREIEEIGCLALNIEGSEYEVLERLIDTGLIARIRCVMVQFHVIGDASDARRTAIRSALTRTHSCNFEFPFVWESWTRNAQQRPTTVKKTGEREK
jgi:FkbM family methyltransferase